MSVIVKLLKPLFTDIEIPAYATENSAGMDARADIQEDVVIEPLQRKVISTGLRVSIPNGYTIDVDSRSGLAAKNGVFVLNSPGIIDQDFRGTLQVILANLGDQPFTVKRGDRICQLLLRKVEHIQWDIVDQLDETERNEGGFGHTGVK